MQTEHTSSNRGAARPNAIETRRPRSSAGAIFPTSEQMAVLWQRMADLFPNRWLNQVGPFVDEDGRESSAAGAWRSALQGLRGQQLAVGLQALIASAADYPPSAGRFRKLCFSDVPDELAAYREACKAAGADGRNWRTWRWSHPVVYAAAHDFGTWDLAHLDSRSAMSRWGDCYRRALDRFAAGEELTAPVPERLAPPARKPSDPAVAKAHLDALREFFREPEPEPIHQPEETSDEHAPAAGE